MRETLLTLFFFAFSLSYSQTYEEKIEMYTIKTSIGNIEQVIVDSVLTEKSISLTIPIKEEPKKRKNKLIATALAITLGPFGVHRLYLGTNNKVPLFYTLTLGGGLFILPIIDIVYILTSKNPDTIENNSYFFIWNKKKESDK